MSRPGTMIATATLGGFALLALGAELGLWGSQANTLTEARWSPPSSLHWLGTDSLGRDLMDRAIQGARLSLICGVWGAAGTLAIGTALGGWAGMRGGLVDRTLSMLADVFTSLPALVALLGLSMVLRPGIMSLAFAIAVTQWPGTFRAFRIEAQRLASSDFVRASEAMGASPWERLRVHVFPHLSVLIGATFAIQLAWSIRAEAVLGWLGLGSTQAPSWGRILAESGSELARGIWWPMAAGAVPLFAVVLAVQVIADRDEPRDTAD